MPLMPPYDGYSGTVSNLASSTSPTDHPPHDVSERAADIDTDAKAASAAGHIVQVVPSLSVLMWPPQHRTRQRPAEAHDRRQHATGLQSARSAARFVIATAAERDDRLTGLVISRSSARSKSSKFKQVTQRAGTKSTPVIMNTAPTPRQRFRASAHTSTVPNGPRRMAQVAGHSFAFQRFRFVRQYS